MHFTIDRADLLAALRRGGQLSGRSKNVPILACVVLRAKDGGLTVASSDMDHWSALQVPAAISSPGDIAVNGPMLTKAVSELTAGKVDVSLDDGTLRLSAGRTKLRFPTLPASDFPAASPVKGAVTTITVGELRRIGEVLIWAASTEATRPYLCVTCLRPTGDRLRAWATDGHVLARTDVAFSGTLPAHDVMLPVTAWAPLRSLLDGAGEADAVEIQVAHHAAAFRVGPARFRTKLTDGRFPDVVDQLIRGAASGKHETGFDRDAMTAALRRVRVAAVANTTSAVKLTFNDEGIDLTAGGANGAAAEDYVEASGSAGLAIGFSAPLLLDALGAMPAGGIVMRLTDPASPTVLWPSGTALDEAGLAAMVMPYRV
ncbi:DNA polymerase III subunit beta [Azospirillum aestuarii]|uniref:DNA polymerase III subunit beta n=1 Tax=Azospirillum aestuarii TaxID=2802052 RepID=UPI004054C10D